MWPSVCAPPAMLVVQEKAQLQRDLTKAQADNTELVAKVWGHGDLSSKGVGGMVGGGSGGWCC